MKKYLLAVTVLTAFLSGCMDAETRIIVNPDGSGFIHETFMVKNAVVEQMKKGFGSEKEPKEEKKLYKMDELIKKSAAYGEGVAFVSVKDTANATHQGYIAVYSFKDVTRLKINQSLQSKMKQDDTRKPDESEYLVFLFTKGAEPTLTVIMPEKKPKEEAKKEEGEKPPVDDKKMEQQMKMMKAMFDGMRLALILQVNGTITRTNAANVKENVVTLFDIEFSKFLDNTEKLKEMSKSKPKSMEETKAMLKGIPGIVIETAKKVSVTFKGK